MRRSLRGMLAAASILLGAAWLGLFLTHSLPIYIAIEALLFGPVMAIMGSVLAPTVVTRWFGRNRGLAIGLVHLPVMVAIMPIATEWLIQHIGLPATFLVLAAIPILSTLPASFLLQDWPPELRQTVGVPVPAVAHGPTFTMGQMLKQPRFWLLTLAVTVPNTSSVLLGTHLVSMAESWGIQPLAAAGLASIMSLVGMIGMVTLGLVADRIGGARTLALRSTGNYGPVIVGMVGAFVVSLVLALVNAGGGKLPFDPVPAGVPA